MTGTKNNLQLQRYAAICVPDTDVTDRELICILDQTNDYYECLLFNKTSGKYFPNLITVPKSNVTSMNEEELQFKNDLQAILAVLEGNADPLLTLLACAMRDWIPQLQSLLVSDQTDLYREITQLVEFLSQKTKLLLLKAQTKHENTLLRIEIIEKIQYVNRLLGFDRLLFDEHGELMSSLTKSNVNIIEAYQNVGKVNYSSNDQGIRNVSFKFLSYNSSVLQEGDSVQLYCYIYNSLTNQPVSETFGLLLDDSGVPIGDEISCIYENIECRKSLNHLYLFIKAIQICKPLTLKEESKTKDFLKVVKRKMSKITIATTDDVELIKKPIGIAKIPLKSYYKLIETEQLETSFYLLSTSSNGMEHIATCTNEKMTLEIQLLKSVVSGNHIRIPQSLMTPFTDTNQMYISLQNAIFSITKAVGFSVQVSCQLRLSNGMFIPDSFMCSENSIIVSEFKSVVIPNCVEPLWNDTFKIVVEPSEIQNAHLLFTFKNVGKQEMPIFAFAFMPLVQSKKVMLNDSNHELKLYKYEPNFASPSNYLSFPAGPNLLVPVHLSLSSVTSMAAAAQSVSKLPVLEHRFFVKTRLFSTHLSQDVNLVNLTLWKRTDSLSRSPLSDIIRNFDSVSEYEMVTMCQSTFDAFIDLFFEMGPHISATLFDIVLPNKGLVLDSFIIFLSAFTDPKFEKQRQTLIKDILDPDSYRSNLPMLAELFKNMVHQAASTENGKIFRRMVKVWDNLLKIIISSSKAHQKDTFLIVSEIFQSLGSFLELESNSQIVSLKNFFESEPSPLVLASQTAAIQNLDILVYELVVFDDAQRFALIQLILSKIDRTYPTLVPHFLKLLNKLLKGLVFEDVNVNSQFVKLFMEWTLQIAQANLASSKTSSISTSELAIDVLNSIVAKIKLDLSGQKIVKSLEAVVGITMEQWAQLITHSCQMISEMKLKDEESNEVTSRNNYFILGTKEFSLYTLFISVAGTLDFEFMIEILRDLGNAKMLKLILSTIQKSLRHAPFEAGWVMIEAEFGSSMSQYLCAIHALISDFNTSIIHWNSFPKVYPILMDTSLSLVFSKYCGIKSNSFQRTRVMASQKINLRMTLAQTIRNCIEDYGKLRDKFETFLEFPESTIRLLLQEIVSSQVPSCYFAFDLLYKIMELEFTQVGNIRGPEQVIFGHFQDKFNKEDRFYDFSAFHSMYFTKAFYSKFNDIESEFHTAGLSFMKSLGKFITILTSMSPLDQIEGYVSSSIKMLRFLRQNRHQHLFVAYVHQLYQHHLNNKNYVEAAIVLMQEAELLSWRTDVYIENAHIYSLPDNSTEFELNEQIHLTCIKLLDLAECWERALELTRVLESKYDLKIRNYHKLAEILKTRVSLYEKIFQEHRSFPTYFRVSYFGKGFNERLDGKQFIYRGENWEQIGTFCETLERIHGKVTFNYSKAPFDSTTISSPDEKVIQINVVQPVPELRHWRWSSNSEPLKWTLDKHSTKDYDDIPMYLFTPELFWDDPIYQDLLKFKETLPQYIKTFHANNELSMFSLSIPFKRDDGIQHNQISKEFATLWTEMTIFCTEYSLPSLSRRTRVLQTMTFEISPIENAIIAIRTKTQELLQFCNKYSRFAHVDVDELNSPDTKWSIDTGNSNPSNLSEVRTSNTENLNVNAFSMALKGAVDAPVNGGVKMYKLAFLDNPDFGLKDKANLCKVLQDAIMGQVEAISKCIPIHGELVSLSMKPFHREIVKSFEKNFHEEILKLKTEFSTTESRISPATLFTNSANRINMGIQSRLSLLSGKDSLSIIRNSIADPNEKRNSGFLTPSTRIALSPVTKRMTIS